MKNTLSMALFSRKTLTEKNAFEQIAAIASFKNGMISPDKWGAAEPMKTPFDLATIGCAVRQLADPQGQFLYRKGNPVRMSGEMWNLSRSSSACYPSPLFCNYLTGRFDGDWVSRIGLENVKEFVSEIFRVMSADYGLLTTEADLKAKNTDTSAFSYQGMTLEEGLPGLYWMNLFSCAFGEWVGVSTIPKELASVTEVHSGCLELTFSEFPAQCREMETLRKQSITMEWLGKEKFFDIRSKDRSLVTPDWSDLPVPNPD